MAETAPAAVGPSKSPGKAKKKPASKAQRSDGPSIPKMILEVMAESKDRKGTSAAALKKALGVKGLDVAKCNKRINTALVRVVEKGALVQTKGSGASGSFKLAKKEAAAKPKADKKKKTSAGQKPAKKVIKPKKAGAAASPAKKKNPKNFKRAANKSTPKKSKPASSPSKTAAKAKPKAKPAKIVAKKTNKTTNTTKAKVTKKPAPKKTKK
ncbi:histone H1-like [Phyllopteryx taeniolatus]|uniref:histone H1-like n=1 Tax=Phyllopteryx taeniolatus TaxID=161469 RepID=UPI002AD5A1D1|nr:histone H1-like [Phyllopteryx taeniolatus]